MVDLLDLAARAVQALKHDKSITFWGLWRKIAEQSVEHLETIIRNINGREPGPLDQELNLLITRWLEHARDTATAWVQDAVTDGRRGVQMALARGFSGQQWHLLGDPFADIWAAGTNDPDPDIAQAFLAAAGAYLSDQPTAAVDVLLERGISQLGATRALEDACNYDGRTYGAALNTDDAGAVLQLISRAGYDSYAVQEIVTGIATTHPQLLLEHLRGQANNGVRIRDDIHELDTAYDAHPDALATWIRNNLNNPHADLVLGAAVNDHLTMNQGAALAQLAADLDGDQLRSFVDVLAHIETWALDQPDLAHAITNRAREAGTHDQTRRRIKDAMRPRHWRHCERGKRRTQRGPHPRQERR